MIRVNLTLDVLVATIPTFNNFPTGIPRCLWAEGIEFSFFDLLGDAETHYTVQTIVDVTGFQGTPLCHGKYSVADWPFHTGGFDFRVMAGDRVVALLPPRVKVSSLALTTLEEDAMLLFDNIVSGEGRIDVHNLAGYAPTEMGVWFGTVELQSYNTNLIGKDFYTNPDRYRLGYLSYGYHGFVTEYQPVLAQKTYLPLRIWLDSLEPWGNPEEVSVWIPVPFYPRCSELNYAFNPSVSARIRIWGDKILKGFDAYF